MFMLTHFVSHGPLRKGCCHGTAVTGELTEFELLPIFTNIPIWEGSVLSMENIVQPGIIEIEPGLRLRAFDGKYDFALDWYQDPELVYLVDGVRRPYSRETLTAMYAYLDQHGELYFIELKREGRFVPVGDVTFWQDDMPIVLGDPACRGKGIGRKVIGALIERARALGFAYLRVGEIYDWNLPSQKCFTAMGFVPYEKTERGNRYRLVLTCPHASSIIE